MKKITLLGNQKTKYPTKPNKSILECFENKHRDQTYLVPFVCTEFTSLCPKTGQPDFASLEIIYVPRINMVESKSLKLYLFSFRNEGSFHEDVTNKIFNDLWTVLDPLYMRIFGNFNLRGGIAIKPLVERYGAEIKGSDQEQEVYDIITQCDRIK